ALALTGAFRLTARRIRFERPPSFGERTARMIGRWASASRGARSTARRPTRIAAFFHSAMILKTNSGTDAARLRISVWERRRSTSYQSAMFIAASGFGNRKFTRAINGRLILG